MGLFLLMTTLLVQHGFAMNPFESDQLKDIYRMGNQTGLKPEQTFGWRHFHLSVENFNIDDYVEEAYAIKQSLFRGYDTDTDGNITMAELEARTLKCGHQYSLPVLRLIFGLSDGNQDGHVDMGEFLTLLKTTRDPPQRGSFTFNTPFSPNLQSHIMKEMCFIGEKFSHYSAVTRI